MKRNILNSKNINADECTSNNCYKLNEHECNDLSQKNQYTFDNNSSNGNDCSIDNFNNKVEFGFFTPSNYILQGEGKK